MAVRARARPSSRSSPAAVASSSACAVSAMPNPPATSMLKMPSNPIPHIAQARSAAGSVGTSARTRPYQTWDSA